MNNNRLKITHHLDTSKINNLLGDDDNPRVSINRLKYFLKNDAVFAASFLGYREENIEFHWINGTSHNNGVSVECANSNDRDELTADLADAKTRIIDALDWIVPAELSVA